MNRIIFEKIKTSYLLPVISSFLTGVSLFHYFTGYLSLVAFVPLFTFYIAENKLKRLCFASFIFHFIGAVVIGLFVLVEPILWFFSGLYFSFFGIFVWLLKKYFSRTLFFIFLPFIFLLFEVGRSSLSPIDIYFTMTGNALASTVFLPLAKLFGIYGLSLLVFFVNLFITRAILGHFKKKHGVYAVIFLVAVLFVSFFISQSVGSKEYKQEAEVVVFSFSDQASFKELDGKKQKISFNNISAVEMNEFLEEFLEKIKNEIPENAEYIFLPGNILNSSREGEIENQAFADFKISNNGSLIAFARKLALDTKKNVIMGIITFEDGEKYNSVLLFNSRGKLTDVYHKADLMLGSDYWPFGDWVPFWIYWTQDIKPGQKVYKDPGFKKSKTPFSIFESEDINIAVLICSETQSNPNFRKIKKNGAEIVFAPINNDWYSGLNLSFYQWMFLSSLRINSFYHDIPIVFNGKMNSSGIVYPDGTYDIEELNEDKPFSVWSGKLNY